METFNPQDENLGRQLWRKYSACVSSVADETDRPDPNDIDPNLLAGYLDGTLDQKSQENIEREFARNDSLLDAMIELRQIRDSVRQPTATDPDIPRRVLANALELVRPEQQIPSSEEERTLRFPDRGWWSRLQWAAAAGVVLTSGLVGYAAGIGAYRVPADEMIARRAVALDLGYVVDEPMMPLLSVTEGVGL